MAYENTTTHSHTIGDDAGLDDGDRFHKEEVRLALRNRGMLLEGLRYPITPTGMHYLLVHFDVPGIESAEWRLKVGGLVANSMSLSLDDLRNRPARTLAVTMECAGNGRALFSPRSISQPWHLEAIGTAEWTGTPLRGILEEAGLSDGATEVLFTGLDRGVQGGEVQSYQRSLHRDETGREEVLLAYAMNGEPLQPQHGFPLRLLVPGWYGMASVKWLDSIEAVAEPFHGYQMDRSYRYKRDSGEAGEPVSLIRVRALMIPPGIPDFLTRERFVQAGPVKLSGMAWAGRAGIERVEVSIDGGATWAEAQMGKAVSAFAWRLWTFDWLATPGPASLCVRATDTEGNRQPLEPQWNVGGYGNNAVQCVPVVVAE